MSDTPTAIFTSGLDLRRAAVRFMLSLSAGVLVFLLLVRAHWAVRLVAGWDALCLVEIGLTWWLVSTTGAADARRMGEGRDPGRRAVAFILLIASFVNLFLAVFLLQYAKKLVPDASGKLALLCILAAASSWVLTHVTYGGRYLRRYYNEGGGLQFPGDKAPDAIDFAYFSFTLGMCFQVSDVVVTGSRMRRLALQHALTSFAYNTAIIALVVNVVLGLLG